MTSTSSKCGKMFFLHLGKKYSPITDSSCIFVWYLPCKESDKLKHSVGYGSEFSWAFVIKLECDCRCMNISSVIDVCDVAKRNRWSIHITRHIAHNVGNLNNRTTNGYISTFEKKRFENNISLVIRCRIMSRY